MTGQEKLNQIFSQIEQYVKDSKLTVGEIANKVAKENAIAPRDLSAIISFLTGSTLNGYIDSRKMNEAYRIIIEDQSKNPKYTVQKAIGISGYSDQPAFIKKFKKSFGKTPVQAYREKDPALLKVQLTWNTLSEAPEAEEVLDNFLHKSDTIFGISRKKYAELQEIMNLSTSFGFDDLQSDTAYYAYSTYGIDLEDAFRLVGEYHYTGGKGPELDESLLEFAEEFGIDIDNLADEDDDEILTREEYYNELVRDHIDDPEFRYAYFHAPDMTVSLTYEVIHTMHRSGIEDITQIDPIVIGICAHNEIYPPYCIRAVDYFNQHATEEYGDAAFHEFIDYVLSNIPIEEAFAKIWNLDYDYSYALDYADPRDDYYRLDEHSLELWDGY